MSNPSFDRSKGSRKWWIIGGGCLALFACVCLVAIFAVLNTPDNAITQLRQLIGLAGAESASIEFVPVDAPVFAIINPNFSQAANAAKVVAILDKNPAIHQKLDELAKQSAGQDQDFNFERDVRPWIGTEIAIALFDIPNLQPAGSQAEPNFVITAPTRDKTKSDEALARLRKSSEAKGMTYTEEKYKDITIVVGKSKSSGLQTASTIAYTTYQNQVLLANSADTIKKAIDTKSGGGKTNLKSSTNYNAVIDKLPKDRALTVFADVAALAKASATATQQPGMDAIAAYKGLGMSLAFNDDGIRLDYTVLYDDSKLPASAKKFFSSYKSDPGKVLDALPASTIFASAGQDLKSLWEYFNDALSQQPETQKSFQQSLKDLKAQTGIDVSEDVFAWMNGEYAISLVPAKPILAAGPTAPSVGVLLMIEAKDPALAKSKLDKIAKALVSQQGLAFATKKVNGVDMQVIKGLETQGLSVGYGFVDNYAVIGSAEDVLALAVDGKKSPLSKDTEFLQSTKPLPQPNAGVTFIAIARVVDLVKTMLPKSQLSDFQKEAEPLLKPLKGLSVSASIPKDGVQTGVFFVHVAE